MCKRSGRVPRCGADVHSGSPTTCGLLCQRSCVSCTPSARATCRAGLPSKHPEKSLLPEQQVKAKTMASRSWGSEGSLPSRLRYVGSQDPTAHSKWCRKFKRYMRDSAPVAWKIMTGEPPEPHTLLGDGSEAAAIEISSDEEATSSSSSDTDEVSSPDPAG